MDMHKGNDRQLAGVLYGILAYATWGILPLYWKRINEVPALEILSHRIFWSFIFVSILILAGKRWRNITEVLKNRRKLLLVAACAVLITINWGVYIWAVNSNHIVDSSLGYYINPLISVILGVTILKEKLNKVAVVSICIAAAGVLVITLEFGRIPWIALVLALSFGFYGLCKKLLAVEALVSLALETTLLSPAALGYILFLQTGGTGSFVHGGPLVTTMLCFAGVVTALPLLWFAKGTNRVNLSTMGFIQYLSPSISLVLGIFLYKESFTVVHLFSFSCIWLALLLYSLSQTGLPLIGKKAVKEL